MNIKNCINLAKPRIHRIVHNKIMREMKQMYYLGAGSLVTIGVSGTLYGLNIIGEQFCFIGVAAGSLGLLSSLMNSCFNWAELDNFKKGQQISWAEKSELKLNSEEIQSLLSIPLNAQQKEFLHQVIKKKGYVQFFDLLDLNSLQTVVEENNIELFCQENALNQTMLECIIPPKEAEIEIEYNFQQRLSERL